MDGKNYKYNEDGSFNHIEIYKNGKHIGDSKE
jgi:antitoxin component YwqK of YwqJK toxin-antitoxin module